MDSIIIANVVKVFTPAALAFVVGIAITPVITKFLYTYKMWKKESRQNWHGWKGNNGLQ